MPGNQENNIILRDVTTGLLRVVKNNDNLQIGSCIELTGDSTLKISKLTTNKILVVDNDGFITTSDSIVSADLPQLSGDVTGSYDNTIISSISGEDVISITSSTLQWKNNSPAPRLMQAGTSSVFSQDLSIVAQDSMHIDGYGGSIKIISGIGNHLDGYVSLITGSTESLRIINSQANSVSFGVGALTGNIPTITSGPGIPSSEPTNGSVYLRTDGSSSTALYAYQNNTWSAISGSSGGGSSYSMSFTSSDLSNGLLILNHNLDSSYVAITIYNSDGYVIIPNSIYSSTNSSSIINLSSFSVHGVWNILAVANTGVGLAGAGLYLPITNGKFDTSVTGVTPVIIGATYVDPAVLTGYTSFVFEGIFALNNTADNLSGKMELYNSTTEASVTILSTSLSSLSLISSGSISLPVSATLYEIRIYISSASSYVNTAYMARLKLS